MENAHIVRKKTFVFYNVNLICTTYWGYRADTVLCEPLRSIRRNCQSMTNLEMIHILQAQVCGCNARGRRPFPPSARFRETIYPSVVLNLDSPAASTAFVANSRFVPASLPVGRQNYVMNLVTRSNKITKFA